MMFEAFDLDFRPKSYWGPQSLASYFGSRDGPRTHCRCAR